MLVLFLVTYVFGLVLLAYDKYCTVLDVFEKPGLYSTPVLLTVFTLVKIFIGYGSLIGIWFTWGLYPALGALVLRFLVSTYLLRHFFNHQVKKYIPACIKAVREVV